MMVKITLYILVLILMLLIRDYTFSLFLFITIFDGKTSLGERLNLICTVSDW